MNKVLLLLAFMFSANFAFAAKATLCKQKAEKMAIAYFQVNYPNDRLLSVESTLTQMNHGNGEASDEGPGSETWDVNLKVFFEKAASEGQLAPVEVQLSIDGLDCNVSMPTAG